MSLHHIDGPDCPLCNAKVSECDEIMKSWFYWVKSNHPEVHASWGFRDEVSQNDAFNRHMSKCKWPQSKHNFMKDGKPHSLAIDIFQILNGVAEFSPIFLEQIYKETKAQNVPVTWGGLFKTIRDYDHFQVDSDLQENRCES